MQGSRREFLAYSSMGMLGAALDAASAQAPENQQLHAGRAHRIRDGAGGGSGGFGGNICGRGKAGAGGDDSADREQAASNWRMQMAPNYEFRVGPSKVALEPYAVSGDAMESVTAGYCHAKEDEESGSEVCSQ